MRLWKLSFEDRTRVWCWCSPSCVYAIAFVDLKWHEAFKYRNGNDPPTALMKKEKKKSKRLRGRLTVKESSILPNFDWRAFSLLQLDEYPLMSAISLHNWRGGRFKAEEWPGTKLLWLTTAGQLEDSTWLLLWPLKGIIARQNLFTQLQTDFGNSSVRLWGAVEPWQAANKCNWSPRKWQTGSRPHHVPNDSFRSWASIIQRIQK